MTTTTLNTCGYGCNDFDLEPHEMCAMCRNRLPTMTTTDTRTNLINSLESALQDEWCTLTTRSTNYAARVVIQGRIAKLRARLVAACKAQHSTPITPRGEDYQLMCEFEPSWWVADPPDCTRARIGEDCRQHQLWINRPKPCGCEGANVCYRCKRIDDLIANPPQRSGSY